MRHRFLFEDTFPEKVTLSKDLQEMRKGTMKIPGGRVFQDEESKWQGP